MAQARGTRSSVDAGIGESVLCTATNTDTALREVRKNVHGHGVYRDPPGDRDRRRGDPGVHPGVPAHCCSVVQADRQEVVVRKFVPEVEHDRSVVQYVAGDDVIGVDLPDFFDSFRGSYEYFNSSGGCIQPREKIVGFG